MKTIHYILFIIWLAIAKAVVAQPVLANIEKPEAGVAYSYCNVENNSTIPAGKGGANVTWDFSTLNPTTSNYNTHFALPSQTAYEADFPTSTAVYMDNFNGYTFRAEKNDTVFMVGYVDGNNNIVLKYKAPQTLLIRPLKFNDAYSGIISYTYTYQGTNNYHGGGSYVTVADGYGTLKLPNGTYNNVLRIKNTQLMQDTVVGQATARIITKTTHYAWYNQYNNVPVMMIDSVAVSAPGFNNISHNIYYLQNALNTNKKVTKNAVTATFDNAQLKIGGLEATLPTTVEVFDITGKQLAGTYIAQGDEAVCSLATLPQSGQALFVRVINGNAVQNFKFIIY